MNVKPSNFLRAAAVTAEAGFVVRLHENKEAALYYALTMPTSDDHPNMDDLIETRPMRLLLAAEMAQDDGR